MNPILATITGDVADHCSDHWIELLFAAFILIAFGTDVLRVATGKTSWSLIIWKLNYEHPTLIVLEVLIGIGLCFLLRHSWPSVMIAAALLIGHLAASNEYQPPKEGT